MTSTSLRRSDPLDANTKKQSGTTLFEHVPLSTFINGDPKDKLPWEGGIGSRAMLDLPFRPPFNESGALRPPHVMRLVRALLADGTLDGELEKRSFGVALEQFAYIAVGPRTTRPPAHTDSPPLASSPMMHRPGNGDDQPAGKVPWLPDIPSITQQPPVVNGFTKLLPELESGARTFSLNLQLPLMEINETNGPTALCPATHSDQFCRTFMPLICRKKVSPHEGSVDGEVIDQLVERYVHHSRFCSGPHRVLATASVGDALLYDSRLLHFGSANEAYTMRDIVSFTYVHEWYTETNRDLTKEAVTEAVNWRRFGRDERAEHGRQPALAQMSLEQLADTHDKMRWKRDMNDYRQYLHQVMYIVAPGYYLWWRAYGRHQSAGPTTAAAAKGDKAD